MVCVLLAGIAGSRLRCTGSLFEMRSGTGSSPPLPQGWQRANRRSASHDPRTIPKRLIAVYAYSEHVGRYRQRLGEIACSTGKEVTCTSGRRTQARRLCAGAAGRACATGSGDPVHDELVSWRAQSLAGGRDAACCSEALWMARKTGLPRVPERRSRGRSRCAGDEAPHRRASAAGQAACEPLRACAA